MGDGGEFSSLDGKNLCMETSRLPTTTTLGHVHLTVSGLRRSLDFYQGVLGFELIDESEGSATLGALAGDPQPGERALLRLEERPGAARVAGTTGLYHFAPRVPSRADLAQLIIRIGESRTPVQGMVDHHTHEAVYLSDPEGNGIELYVDRPREVWPGWPELTRRGNAPLDVESLLAELGSSPPKWPGLSAGAAIGHVHLHVADLAESDAFYVDVLGLDLVGRFPGQAHFTSAGGYHHHLAYNIWAGRGAPPLPPGSRGLRHFTLLLPGRDEFSPVQARLAAAGRVTEETDEGFLATDPSGNGVLLAVRS